MNMPVIISTHPLIFISTSVYFASVFMCFNVEVNSAKIITIKH